MIAFWKVDTAHECVSSALIITIEIIELSGGMKFSLLFCYRFSMVGWRKRPQSSLKSILTIDRNQKSNSFFIHKYVDYCRRRLFILRLQMALTWQLNTYTSRSFIHTMQRVQCVCTHTLPSLTEFLTTVVNMLNVYSHVVWILHAYRGREREREWTTDRHTDTKTRLHALAHTHTVAVVVSTKKRRDN